MNNITAIILCGGLGTRLRAISGNLPKPMVKVAGRPFLEYILDYLVEQKVSKAVLAVCYQKEQIINHFGDKYKNIEISYSIESSALGTGGAIKKALLLQTDAKALSLIINGDTLTSYSLANMVKKLKTEKALLVMSIQKMEDTSRYGRVKLSLNKINAFAEKQSGVSGFINTGVYLVRNRILHNLPKATTFSFEKDYLAETVQQNLFSYSISKGYFIDIGIPKDHRKAERDFARRQDFTKQQGIAKQEVKQ